MKKRMNGKLNVVCGLSVLALALAACGKSPEGTYSVNQNFVNSGASYGASYTSSLGSCSSTQFNMNITENNNTVSGSGTHTCFNNETLSGTDDGNGHLNNVTLSIPISSSATSGANYTGSPYYPTSNYNNYGNNGIQMTCTYTGSLNFNDNNFNGTLNLQSSGYQNYSCPSSVTLTANKN